MRALICGAGGAAHVHAMAYRACGIDVAGVYDPDPARASTFAVLYGAEQAKSDEHLLEFDAEYVSICSPPPRHLSQSLYAAQVGTGRTIFVEKPIATSPEGFDSISALPGAVPVVQWRAGRGLRAVRAAVAAGLLGPMPTVNVELSWYRAPSYFTAGRSTYAEWGGGVLLSVAVHAIDAVCFALGDEWVSATGLLGYDRPEVEVETSAALMARFERGAQLALTATFDAGEASTWLSFSGNGVTAQIEGPEFDPTAGRVSWTAQEHGVLDALLEIEAECGPPTSSPLHVPYMAGHVDLSESLADQAVRIPERVTMQDVRAAHDIAWHLYASAGVPVVVEV